MSPVTQSPPQSTSSAPPLTARPGWERTPDENAADTTLLPRLERYRLYSSVLPQPESRDIWIYLPPQYAQEPARRFPTFYLQDGQNLIDPKTSFVPGQTWQAHATADSLAQAGEIEPIILIGIANAGVRRMAEYTPRRDARMGGGEGRKYGRLLVDELKPLVDAAYRTCPGPHDTAIGGSSLGGLISLFLGFENPAVFSKIAALSPSIWWDQRSILQRLSDALPKPELRIWLDMGGNEGARHVRDAITLYRQLLRQGWVDHENLEFFLAEGAEHNEGAWAARFDRVLRFLFPPRPQS